uniref:orotidine-5'-phosphate decarboxylase n=1 Tax=Stomatohabitans albus TaxID=3110766 RepID=UPI00300C2623
MNPLIVALDHPDRAQILAWATDFGPHVGMVKIGLEAFCAHGPDLVRSVHDHAQVFLDLKLHDIPNTVAGAARQCNALGVSLLTVHASGGPEMIAAAVEAAPDVRVIAVTVLTSLNAQTLSVVGQGQDVNTQVQRLAKMAI